MVDATKTYEEMSALRDAPMTLARLTGIFLQAVRCHFSDTSRLYIPMLRDLVWIPSEDPALSDTTSKISIEPEYMLDMKNAMKRPFITVHRGGINSQSLGIGGGSYQSPAAAATTGAVTYHRMRTGTMSVGAISSYAKQAELLVDELDRYFQDFVPHWRRQFQLTKLDVVQIGDVKPTKENKQVFRADITMQYAYQHVWSLTPQAPELGNVSLSVV